MSNSSLDATKLNFSNCSVNRAFTLATPLLVFALFTACASRPTTIHERFVFTYGEGEVSGVLQLPQSPGPHPAVIFVHGDGEMTWDGYGYYTPLQEAMVAAGFAVLSWDKPGVGKSTGNWLSQSMHDRAEMVTTASRLLKARDDIQAETIGLWGISQAGWVMPIAVTQTDDFAFMISVSGAINLIQQGGFYMRNRLESEGYEEDEIVAAFALYERENALLRGDGDYNSYAEFIRAAPPCCRSLKTKERWEFIKKNLDNDAGPYLEKTSVPVLAIFGDKDLNVDIEDSVQNYTQYLTAAGNSDITIKVFKNADHGLMPTPEGEISGRGGSAYLTILKIHAEGAGAFVNDYISFTVAWLSQRFTANQNLNFLGE